MSSDTASFMEEPENAIRVADVSTPEVPSKTYPSAGQRRNRKKERTWTTAFFPLTSRT